ncbi:MAG: hypothetical protein V3575_02035, partial [Candidatus Absconditabacteria bacterium]
MNKTKFVKPLFLGVFFAISINISFVAGSVNSEWTVGETVKINFQGPDVTPPEGYLEDYGDGFGDRLNGFTYGWLNSKGYPETNKSYRMVHGFEGHEVFIEYRGFLRTGGDINPYHEKIDYYDFEGNLQNYTLSHIKRGGDIYKRKIELPNGKFKVKTLSYDPQYGDNSNILVNNLFTPKGMFTREALNVSNNSIELSYNSGETNYAKINYIEITPLEIRKDETINTNTTINTNKIPTSKSGWESKGSYQGNGQLKIEGQDNYKTCKNCEEAGESPSPLFCDISNNNYSSNFEGSSYCRYCKEGRWWIYTSGNNRSFGCGIGTGAPWESPERVSQLQYKNTFYEIDKQSGRVFIKDNLILSKYNTGLNLLKNDFKYNNANSIGIKLILDTKNTNNSIEFNGNIKCENGQLVYKKIGSTNSHYFSSQGKGIEINFDEGEEDFYILWNIVCQSNTKPSNNLLLNENEVDIQANTLKSYSLSNYTPSNINNTLKSPRPADQATFTNILFHQINSIQNLIAIMQSLDIVDDDGNNLDSLFNSTTDYNNYKKWLEHFSSYGSIKHFSDSFGQTITLNDIYISNVVVHGYICSIKNKLNSLGKVSGSCTTSKIVLDKIDNEFIFYNFQQIIDQQKTYLNNLKDITNYFKGITSTDTYISSLINFIVNENSNNILGYGISKNLTNYNILLSTLSATSGGKPNLNSFFNTSMLTNYTLRGALKMAIIDRDISNITDPNIKAQIITDIYTYDLSYMRGYIANLNITDLAEIIGRLKIDNLYSNFSEFLVDFSTYYNQKVEQLGINGLSTYDFMQETIKFLGDNEYLINESNKYENIIKSFNI